MADEKKDDEAPKKGKKKLIIIIAAVAVVVLVAAGLVATMLMKSNAPVSAADDPAKKPGIVIPLTTDMTLNLADGKYLKMNLAVQLTEAGEKAGGGEAILKKFDGSMARDAAINVLGHYTMEQLLKPENKEKAQGEITKECNERYEGTVYKVYFTNFVMQ